ncbi:MAG TPA: hypothetical protein V6D08_14370 [Candidatus Obscuribacterales bacterium]
MNDHPSRQHESAGPDKGNQQQGLSLSDERLHQIGLEIDRLFKDLGKQSASEQLARYCQILELGRERGWVYSADPEIDLARIRCINARMKELSQEVQNREPCRWRRSRRKNSAATTAGP